MKKKKGQLIEILRKMMTKTHDGAKGGVYLRGEGGGGVCLDRKVYLGRGKG